LVFSLQHLFAFIFRNRRWSDGSSVRCSGCLHYRLLAATPSGVSHYPRLFPGGRVSTLASFLAVVACAYPRLFPGCRVPFLTSFLAVVCLPGLFPGCSVPILASFLAVVCLSAPPLWLSCVYPRPLAGWRVYPGLFSGCRVYILVSFLAVVCPSSPLSWLLCVYPRLLSGCSVPTLASFLAVVCPSSPLSGCLQYRLLAATPSVGIILSLSSPPGCHLL
jgi:hypothetical protein